MQKKISGLLAIVVVTSVMFVGCKKNNESVDIWNKHNIEIGLSAQVQEQIVRDYFILNSETYKNATVNNFWISKYFGTFNDAIVVRIADDLGYVYPPSIRDVNIGEFVFHFDSGPERLLAWKDGSFNSLLEAFESEILTLNHIEQIYNLYNLND